MSEKTVSKIKFLNKILQNETSLRNTLSLHDFRCFGVQRRVCGHQPFLCLAATETIPIKLR